MHIKSNHLRNENLKYNFLFFEELFHTYYGSLLLYASKYTNEKQAAEDIVQDVFTALWMKREEIDFNEPIKAYLFKATYNKSLNYLHSTRKNINIDEEAIKYKLQQKIQSFDQQDSILLKEITNEIESFVDTLPAQCRKVFLLSRGEGMKNKEIAKKLNISEKTVEGHISKALGELRIHLKVLDLMPAICLILQICIFKDMS